jgi:hypothetical protein
MKQLIFPRSSFHHIALPLHKIPLHNLHPVIQVASATYLGRILSNTVLKERNVHLDSSLLSFLISSLLSNHRATQAKASSSSSSYIDGLAWSIFLPASLVLNIWSEKQDRSESTAPTTTSSHIPMLVAFAFGCIGTFMGSILSGSVIGRLRAGLAQAAGCLAASYIGGTANFFETANILGIDMDPMIRDIAGIDVGIMVLYFSALQRLQSSSSLRHFTRKVQSMNPPSRQVDTNSSSYEELVTKIVRPLDKILFGVVSLIGAISIVAVARMVSSYFPLPGFSLIIAIALTYACRSISLWKGFFQRASPANEYSIGLLVDLFYSTIGMSLNINSLLSLGLPIIGLITILLAVHLSTVFLGSAMWNMIVSKINADKQRDWHIDVDTALIAR